jgi:hypothetical protein
MDNTLPYLFYTNLKTNAQKKIVYDKTPSKTFKFLAKDIHSGNMFFSFRIVNVTLVASIMNCYFLRKC